MLIVSIAALIAFGFVMARGARFALKPGERRRADDHEVAEILIGSILYVAAYAIIWIWEPHKLINNSIPSIMFVMFTIVTAAYFYRRMGALIVGRNRRRQERRVEPEQDRRAPE